MKAIAVLVLAIVMSVPSLAETQKSCPDLPDLQSELKETKALVTRMQSRIITMRNMAGTVRDFEIRNALQVNADAWQDMLDTLKLRVEHMQNTIDRCEAREKIEGTKTK